MSAASGGNSKSSKRIMVLRNRQRANMSFFIVVMFFAVFGIIVFTEIFLIDERGRGAGVLVRHGSFANHHRTQQLSRDEYDEALQSDDYISIHLKNGGGGLVDENSIGAVLLGNKQAFPVHTFHIETASGGNGGNNYADNLAESNLPSYPEHIKAQDGQWQSVNGTRYKFYVFSAFMDNRKGKRNVRVIGATKTRGPERVWCRLWFKSSEFANQTNVTVQSYTVAAKIKIIRENWNLIYSACFVLCPLQRNQSVPMSVSIVSKVKLPPLNNLVVNDNSHEPKLEKNKFAVCVKPFHFDYNRVLQMLEFMELNRIMGIEHFTFYNHTLGSQVGCILDDYINRGIVSLYSWQLNMVSQKEIRTEGLFAALNDCLYRNMYKYSHVVFIDLDEYIIPRHNSTIPQLIEGLKHRINTRSTGSYSFQNAFFYLQWGDGEWIYESQDPIAAGLVTLKKVRRKTKLHPHKQRSKYVCRPEVVVEVGNHFVWEFVPGHGTFNVPSDSGLLHHYRICEFGGDDCINTASTIDTTAYRYKEELVERVGAEYKRSKDKCGLLELPPPPERSYERILSLFKGTKGGENSR